VEHADLSLVETSDGLQVVFEGRALYDTRPASSAARKALSLPTEAQTLYLLASPVAWHGVARFLSRLPDGSAILAVESDPILLELATRLRPPEFPRQRVLLSAADAPSIRAALAQPDSGRGGLSHFRRVREITFSRGALMNRPRYREIRKMLEQDIRIHWQNRLTLSAMGRLWVGNVIRNLPRLATGAAFPALHKPVVVCGAGPSLSASLPLLHGERRNLIVVAVDTALPSLSQSGIIPDFVIAIEGQLVNVYDFLPIGSREYTLVADLSSAPSVIELHDPQRVLWVSSRFAELGLLDRIAAAGLPLRQIPPLGSVGVSAVHLALTLTDGPVLLTGLDFAFRIATHAPGAPGHLARLISDQRLHSTPPPDLAGKWMERQGADGKPVATTLTLIGYAEQLAALVTADTLPADGPPPGARVVAVIEPFGLDTGARPVTVDQAGEIISGYPPVAGSEGEAARPTPAQGNQLRGQQGRIGDLLAGEIELLKQFEILVEAALSGTGNGSALTDEALSRTFAICDYVAVDFPDFTPDLGLDLALLARLRIAIDFYSDRLRRSERLERSLKYHRS